MHILLIYFNSPADPDDYEAEVFPSDASANTEFKWGFMFWTFMHYDAKKALGGNSWSFWQSANNVQNDHWEAVFSNPQKINVIDIKWRHPPTRFKVHFKLDDNTDWIPATDLFDRVSKINKEGQKSVQDSGGSYNAVDFRKPIFAKRVRINLNEPVMKGNFSIEYVKFYQKKDIILIENQMLTECTNLCFYVNSDKPRENMIIEAYSCNHALSQANNMELFVYSNDRSVRHFNSKLCIGFNQVNELVLKACNDYNPAYTLQFHGDSTLYFDGYQDQCIYVEDKVKLSPNFIDHTTDLVITSQADTQTYKKENVKCKFKYVFISL
jgi:hypothetical protein